MAPSQLAQKFGLSSHEVRRPYEEVELGGRPAAKYDKATGTQKACIAGLCFSILIGVASIVVGVYAKGSAKVYKTTPAAREFIPLSINFLVLLVTESLGYIHSISLRWALFYENRLEFNSNLRLLTFSKTSFPNGVLCNGVFFICAAVCYAASPMILIPNAYAYYFTAKLDVSLSTSLSRAIPITLGIAILIQCLLSTWCILASKIPSWSSDPLNTMAVGIVEGMPRQDGRCMMSVHDRSKTSTPQLPRARQQSAYAATPKLLCSLVATSIVIGALTIWAGVTISKGDVNSVEQTTRSFTLSVLLRFFVKPTAGPNSLNIIHEPMMLGVLAFSTLIQSVVTLGLHCVELQVNLSRDEFVWRTLASKTGSVTNTLYNSTRMPLRSWQSLCLLLFKPVIHWLYGAAMQVDYASGIFMRAPHITYLTILWAFLIGFAVLVALNRPKGALPSTFGHLPTMMDIIDEWSPKMYWGDKSVQDDGNIRHAGTSDVPLPKLDMKALYDDVR